MQDRGVKLTADEVRDLFSAYHDHELSVGESEGVRKALESDPALLKEYEGFCRMLESLSSLGGARKGREQRDSTPPADLLPKVQDKLYQRSRGKFYRDRWSRTAGLLPLEIMAMAVIVAMVLAYVLMTSITVKPVPNTPRPAPETQQGPRGAR
jgi:hypothetical protein